MQIIRIRGKLKGIFFATRLDIIFSPFTGLIIFVGYMAKLGRWINQHRKLGFSDFYTGKFDYSRRYDLYKYVIEKENLNKDVDYLEFGVSKGASFKWWAENIQDENSAFYGFDTFTGLPEDWGPFKKGAMSGNNKVPEIDDRRCTFYQGLFQKTLDDFLANHSFNKRTILHLDADLYSATLYVLTAISSKLKSGDILFFDEFNVPLHEFKAFMEWTSSFYINYEVLGAVNNFYQVAIKIK